MRGSFDWVPMFSGQRLRRDLGREFPGMARIPAVDLNCVFYLYPDSESAKSGRGIGGSGFWVAVPSEKVEGLHWFYAVSNQHVVHRQAASVLRVNMKTGKIGTIETDPTEWTEHPDGHDIAVLPVNLATAGPINLTAVPIASFVSETFLDAGGIQVGDDVYMIGRFIGHEGRARVTPSARFGNVSMLPGEPIYIDEKTKPQESFVVELRSMCGYSGSPVFVVTSGWTHGRRRYSSKDAGDFLLGVHWGHIIEPWTLETRIVRQADRSSVRPGEREIEFVSANTGMNGVVPAWRLREFLDLPKFREARETEEAMMVEKRRRTMPGAKLDSAQNPPSDPDVHATDENPKHREDFNSLLSAAVKKREPED